MQFSFMLQRTDPGRSISPGLLDQNTEAADPYFRAVGALRHMHKVFFSRPEEK